MFFLMTRVIKSHRDIVIRDLNTITLHRLGFGKNSGKFYVTIDSNPNNTVGSSYLR